METNLYAQLADSLVEQIRQGVFRPSEKMPSVRLLARRESVSISTVSAAYELLERRGWVEARERSGYFVQSRSEETLSVPKQTRTRPRPLPTTLSQLVMEVQRGSITEGANFSRAIPSSDFPIIRQVQRTYTRLSRTQAFLGIGYDTPEGLLVLRQQIARRAVDAGVFAPPESIIVTTGCQNAMAHCLRVVTQPGDIVAVESPCYYGQLQMIEALGLQTVEIPAHPETGLSLEALQLALDKWPIKAIMTVPTFSNPLGCNMPDENKRALVDLLDRYDIPLIEDDIYGDLHFAEQRPKAVKAFDKNGRVLLCSSLSKTIDPQFGIGWIIPGRYFEEVVHSKFVTSHAMASLPQMVAAEILAQGAYERHLRLARETYRQRYQFIVERITEYFPPETRVSRPEGGLVVWLQFPPQVDTTKLYHRGLTEHIRIAPGELFSVTGKYRNCMRLNYALAWSPEKEEALRKLGSWVKEAMDEA